MAEAAEVLDMDQQFALFASYGEAKSDGKMISLAQVNTWLNQSQVIDGKYITSTDVGTAFGKFQSKTISQADFIEMLEGLASLKKVSVKKLTDMLLRATIPKTTCNTTMKIACGKTPESGGCCGGQKVKK